MHVFDIIAEQRIAEAIANGDLDDLPGAGRPLDLDDDRLIAEELRMAYRVLRNAGLVPPQVEARKEAATLRALLASALDEGERSRALARLAVLEMQLDARGTRLHDSGYYARLAARFER
jgi:Domain of unknown function (DUF1992)